MKAPTRFVGLHAHDGFSTFDGLDYPQDHIDFTLANGMNALAITNHGHMNSFAHAYLHTQKLKKAGTNFKFIPGCEMYVHPDLNVWQTEYELKKARKKGDQSEIQRLLEIKEELASPLFAVIDGDDEIVDVGKSEAGLTIENEDETKSAKFFDPIKRLGLYNKMNLIHYFFEFLMTTEKNLLKLPDKDKRDNIITYTTDPHQDLQLPIPNIPGSSNIDLIHCLRDFFKLEPNL